MSEENDFDGQTDGGKLRKMYEDALKEKKALADKLAEFEAKERTQSVEKFFSEKGLNPKLAKFVSPEDAADPSRLDAWVKENADMFGTPNPPQEETGEQEVGGEPSVPTATQQAFTQIQRVTENGAHAVTDLSAIQAQMMAAKSPDELNAVLAQYRMS